MRHQQLSLHHSGRPCCSPRAALCGLIVILFLGITGCPTTVCAQSCCDGATGNLDCDNSVVPDLGDLVALLDHLYITFPPLCCPSEANTDGSLDGAVDISDVTALIDYLYRTFHETAPCDQERIITDSMRLAVFDAIAPVFDSLMHHSTQFLADLHAHLTTIPKFEATGIDTATQSVWARFLDGSLYIAVDNFSPATDSGTARLVAQASTPANVSGKTDAALSTGHTLPAGLPWSTRVRSLVTVDSQYRPANALIEQMLTDRGYTVVSRDASVDALRQVGGDGVLYMMTHGGHAHMRYDREIFALETATPVTPDNLGAYSPELLINRLVIMQVTNRATNSSALHYAITPDFIIANWADFAPNAMVFINTTGSLGPQATALRDFLIEKKASTCFGWSGPVDADAANFIAGFLFDRLLGANMVEPKESPSQRPFDYLHIVEDITGRTQQRDGVSLTANLLTEFNFAAGPGDFGLLAPSIRQLSVNDSSVLTITGLFGQDPESAGRVVIGATALPVLSWEPTQIRAQLPDSGEGSFGRVAVEVDQRTGGPSTATRRSNEVNLTDWHGQLLYIHRDAGTLTYTINSDVHFRADLHSYRDEPHTEPIQPVVTFVGANDSRALVHASGTHLSMNTPEVSTTYSWSGDCTLPVTTSPADNSLTLGGTFDTENYLLTLHLAAAGDSCLAESRVVSSGDSTGAFLPASISGSLYDDVTNLLFHLPLELNWDIQPGLRQITLPSRVDSSRSATCKLQWNTVSAAYPPDPSAPR